MAKKNSTPSQPSGLWYNTLLLQRAARLLAQGGIIAYPTEAVYGLGCDPRQDAAIIRLLHLKRRAPQQGLIVIAAHPEQLTSYILWPDKTIRASVLETWPGPVTWLLPARAGVSPLLTGGRPQLAVRVTAHPIANALCRLNGPLVSTSANVSGHPPARSALQVRQRLGAATVDAIVNGTVDLHARPSMIRDAVSGRIIRRG